MIVEKLNHAAEVKKVAIGEAGIDVRQMKGGNKRSEFGAAAKDNRTEIEKAIEKMNKALELFNIERRFVIDDKTKELVVKIIDRETGEVIDQIPPEEALKRYYEMQRFIGLLFNKRV